MRANKNIAKVSVGIAVTSLIVAICCDMYEVAFYREILIGIFSGTILSFITAMIGYFNKKRELQYQAIECLTTMMKKINRFKPYRTNQKYILISLEALKDVFDDDLKRLAFIVHGYSSFFDADCDEFRALYDYLEALKNKHWNSVVFARRWYIDIGIDTTLQKNYTEIEKDIIEWIPTRAGNGQRSKNKLVEKMKSHREKLIKKHNEKHWFW